MGLGSLSAPSPVQPPALGPRASGRHGAAWDQQTKPTGRPHTEEKLTSSFVSPFGEVARPQHYSLTRINAAPPGTAIKTRVNAHGPRGGPPTEKRENLSSLPQRNFCTTQRQPLLWLQHAAQEQALRCPRELFQTLCQTHLAVKTPPAESASALSASASHPRQKATAVTPSKAAQGIGPGRKEILASDARGATTSTGGAQGETAYPEGFRICSKWLGSRH